MRALGVVAVSIAALVQVMNLWAGHKCISSGKRPLAAGVALIFGNAISLACCGFILERLF